MGRDGVWVCLVEDDPAIADMYRLGLQIHGFEVTVARSGRELFSSINGHGPDIVVLDYHLPGANGAEVLEAIRDDERTRLAMVFMLSNFPQTFEGAIDRVIAKGAIAWYEKAKTPPVLLARRLKQALKARSDPRRG